jgi:hypothetical protein
MLLSEASTAVAVAPGGPELLEDGAGVLGRAKLVNPASATSDVLVVGFAASTVYHDRF